MSDTEWNTTPDYALSVWQAIVRQWSGSQMDMVPIHRGSLRALADAIQEMDSNFNRAKELLRKLKPLLPDNEAEIDAILELDSNKITWAGDML